VLCTRTFQTFLALRDVSNFVDEFSLRIGESDSVVIPEMPYLEYATDRRKRFRYANCPIRFRLYTVLVKLPLSRRVHRGPRPRVRKPSGARTPHRRDDRPLPSNGPLLQRRHVAAGPEVDPSTPLRLLLTASIADQAPVTELRPIS